MKMKCHKGDQIELKDGRKGIILRKKGSIIEVGIYHEPESEMLSIDDIKTVLFTAEELRKIAKEKFSLGWEAISTFTCKCPTCGSKMSDGTGYYVCLNCGNII